MYRIPVLCIGFRAQRRPSFLLPISIGLPSSPHMQKGELTIQQKISFFFFSFCLFKKMDRKKKKSLHFISNYYAQINAGPCLGCVPSTFPREGQLLFSATEMKQIDKRQKGKSHLMKNSSRKCRRKKREEEEAQRWGDHFIIHTSTDGKESVPEVVKVVVVDLKPITALHYLPFSSLWLTPGGKGMVGGGDEIKRRGLIKEI